MERGANLHPESLNCESQAGVELLYRAWQYAMRLDRDVWDFAVEWPELQRLGLATCDARWLLAAGYVDHAIEVDRSGDEPRKFRSARENELCGRSCFVLSECGLELFADASRPPEGPTDPPPDADETGSAPEDPAETPPERDPDPPSDGMPTWDGERKELRMGGILVKRFRWPAPNQETILTVFEEEGWPPRIDDPLPPAPDVEPKRRLHDTIKCLNRNQDHRVLRFRGDGTGEGVVWDATGYAGDAGGYQ